MRASAGSLRQSSSVGTILNAQLSATGTRYACISYEYSNLWVQFCSLQLRCHIVQYCTSQSYFYIYPVPVLVLELYTPKYYTSFCKSLFQLLSTVRGTRADLQKRPIHRWEGLRGLIGSPFGWALGEAGSWDLLHSHRSSNPLSHPGGGTNGIILYYINDKFP